MKKLPIGHKAATVTTGLAAFAMAFGSLGAVASAASNTSHTSSASSSAMASASSNTQDRNGNNGPWNNGGQDQDTTWDGNMNTGDNWWNSWTHDWNNMWNQWHHGQDNNNGGNQGWNLNQILRKFNNGLNGSNAQFRTGVRSELNKAYDKIGNNNQSRGLRTFYNRFQADNAKYDSMMNQAESQWRHDMNSGMNRDEARNRFIDRFNNAKAWYVNDLNQAKDQLSTDLNNAGQAVVKDQFMNRFNKWLDRMNNQQETLKNTLAKETM